MNKVPQKYIKILKELEKVAPDLLHLKDLAYRCNLSPRQVGQGLGFCYRNLDYVEKVGEKRTAQYRLILEKKYVLAGVTE